MAGSEFQRLLRGLFTPEELTHFLDTLQDGEEIVASLPVRGASHDDLVHAAVHALERRGLIDRSFVVRLLTARPGRTQDIQRHAATLGLEVPLAQELEILLAQGYDTTARARLSEVGRVQSGARAAFNESTLIFAQMAALGPNANAGSADVEERLPLTARIRELATMVGGEHGADGARSANRSDSGARAGAIHEEIVAAVQINEGERAALRLLDLTRLCGALREPLKRAILLSSRVHAWRQAHGSLRAASRASREEWMALLGELLAAADAVMPGAGSVRIADGTTMRDIQAPHSRTSAGDNERIFSCASLCKKYVRSPRFQLQDIDLELRPGALVGVVGPNGAGKTTLLRIVAGDLAADGGRLEYPALDASPGALDWEQIRRQIGYVQQRLTPWHGALADNLHVWAAQHGVHGRHNADAVEYMLGRFRLAEMAGATWDQLSGGFQTRFELARALLPQPRLLVLDEPLAALDVKAQMRFLRDLKDFVGSSPSRPAVLISSQHIFEIERVADDILYLREDGRSEFFGQSGALAGDGSPQVYELSGDLRPEVLDVLVRRFGAAAVQEDLGMVVLSTPTEFELRQVVDLVYKAGGALDDVRNISRSVMRLFREKP